ncbi:hypothetical protein [Bradyrhizobium sp. McL0615]|uniref:terminase small subunit-like protein n=1 Tax=Bradyrhizobium sp. McL0615 TaxID=3415673 RepID=UPI003CEFF79F
MARPSEYTEEVATQICERMTEGVGLLKLCQEDAMPSRTTVYRWLEAHKPFRDKYARAREAMMDFYAEQILAVAFDESGDITIEQDGDKTKAVANHAKVQRDRLKVDSLKWIASKLFPRQYGDKLAGDDSRPGGPLTIKWEDVTRIERVIIDPRDHGAHSERPAEPARQQLRITHNPTPPPADLTPEAWSAITRVSELIEQIAPSDETPEHVFGLIEGFLRAHFVASLSESVHSV